MVFRPLPVLSVLTVLSLVILVMLGNWQWSRYSEKLNLPPVSVATAETITATPISVNDGQAQLVSGLVEGLAVWRRYVPANIAGEDETVLLLHDVMVDIAPQPLALQDLSPITAPSAMFVPDVTHSRFAARNQPEENIWYSRDAALLLQNMGFDGTRVVEPIEITIQHPQLGERTVANPYAAPKPIDPLPPQRHFGYALTWWGLAIGLLGVYLTFHIAQGRLSFRKRT